MTGSPRLAILTPYSFSEYEGGTEVFNRELSRCFPGAQVFSSPEGGGRETRWDLDRVGLEHPRRAWAVARTFLQEHHQNPFDFAVSNGLYGWPLSAFPPDIPVIQVYHYTVAGMAERGIARRGVRFRMRHVDSAFDRLSCSRKSVVAVGRSVMQEVRRFYQHDGQVIPNGVDVGMFAPRDRVASRRELGLPEDARIGLYVGRAEYTKGFDILSEIIRQLPEVHFVLVGDCPDVSSNSVTYRHVPHERMPLLYSSADFLLLPSRYEGFSFTIIEALASGLPIVVSRAAYALEEDSQRLGAVVDSMNPEDYLTAVEQLPPASASAAECTRVAAKYSHQRFCENWRTFASSVLHDNP